MAAKRKQKARRQGGPGKPFTRGDRRIGPGRPFNPGFDPRRNLKGPIPELHQIRLAITRDGLAYVDQLFRLAKKGNATAVRVAIEQMLGRPPASIVLTGPGGGPLQLEETHLSGISDEDLAKVKAARAVLDRLAGNRAPLDGRDRAGGTPADVQAQPPTK